jgi:hypothetical protein
MEKSVISILVPRPSFQLAVQLYCLVMLSMKLDNLVMFGMERNQSITGKHGFQLMDEELLEVRWQTPGL